MLLIVTAQDRKVTLDYRLYAVSLSAPQMKRDVLFIDNQPPL